ncbi:aromatic-ring-hydroxylating dioxygenase subunit beta [Alteribacillus iranensis]|uniref:3-phenylpropionate/cinnamic acid dioxygenase, small subunit n=1 Tax=Alteribacillus iranensis TaxID=930128 RepID=A0A1I2F356_9BACI|nr:aromatic-ring-hydroxylating dioxygenase subunit beta [Alteribacillus iranensis]SFE98940.1 3-phenylpropionate/cinnamic acid dioxygenase, small subunit [Alteribacillus iranensis]
MKEVIELQYEIEQWLYHEAHLLDNLLFDDWLELFDEDCRYRMPLRVNLQEKDVPDFTDDTLLFDDDMETLTLRVDRLKTDLAWAETPPSRTRRNVGNVRIQEYNENQVTVKSNLLLYRSRSTEIGAELVSGERTDRLVKRSGKWRLQERTFIADQTTLGTRNLAIFV